MVERESQRTPSTNMAARRVMIVFDSDPERALRHKLRQEERKKMHSAQTHEIEFVHSSTNESVHTDTSKLVRAHVMRDYMRKKRNTKLHQEKFRSPGPDDTNRASSDADVSFEIWPNLPLLYQTGSDSTNMYPIPMNERNFGLFQHYFDLVVESPDRKDIVQLSMTDGALFHMMLLSSLTHLNHIRADPDVGGYDYHQLSAVELVNARLQALHDVSQIPDGTVLAVAYLAISDALLQNFVLCNMHLHGLYKMIEIRGGMERLSPTIQNRTRMADIFCCVRMNLTPHFPMSDLTEGLYQSLATHVDGQWRNVRPYTEFDRLVMGTFSYSEMLRERKSM